ncbi:MAG: hypothetical protein COA88_15515 [Kordia sp.]|nr:MAG: hypothetical protein COA88_15515 [Kordia sp.]
MSATTSVKQQIFNASSNGLDIITKLYSDAENTIGKKNKPFKVRDDEESASAYLWFSPTQNTWCVKDFGDKKAQNSIDLYMHENGRSFSEAIQELSQDYGISKTVPEHRKATLTFSNAKADDKITDYHIEYATKIPTTALATIGVHVTQQVCDKFNFKYVKSLTTFFVSKKTNKLTKLVKEATDNYPIYGFDNGTWHKTYEPFARKEDKAPRFRFFGDKPERYIFGLDNIKQRVLDKRNDNEDEKKAEKDIKLDNAIMVSGGSDGLNVASLNPDYNVIWFNSESEQIVPKEYFSLKKDVKNVYNIADIDNTGIKQAVKLGNEYLGLKHIWLPEKLTLLKDNRGNKCKDIKDYITKYNNKQNPYTIKSMFGKLYENALPFQLWDSYKQKDIWKYKFNSEYAMHFLKHQGFYKIKDEDVKEQFYFIRKRENVVTRVTATEIKDYIIYFVRQKELSVGVRNLILDTTKLSDKSLSALLPIDLNFKSSTFNTQNLSFTNTGLQITPHSITTITNSKSNNVVWQQNVFKHHFTIQKPHFKIDATNPDSCKVDVLKTDNKFLNYVINTSRMFWRDELEHKSLNTPEKKQAYFKANQFNIKGKFLNEEQQQKQQQHLANKIYAFGYFLHTHKKMSSSYFVYAMDNKISDIKESNGGSGKSIMWDVAMRHIYKNVKFLNGRDKETLDDKFALDGVSKTTDAILVDDVHEYFSIKKYYPIVTGSTLVNPKNNKPFEIVFNNSPKIVATSNYQLKEINASTARRLLYVLYSDYYHDNESGDYNENRKVSDDYGLDLFTDFTDSDWNDFYNFVAQCIQFYLGQDKPIKPDMGNANIQHLNRIMGDGFSNWADTYFDEANTQLDRYTSRPNMMLDYKNEIGKNAKNANSFKKSLDAWCKKMEYELNPIDKVPANSQGKYRKMMNDPAIQKSVEHFYIKTNRSQQQPTTTNNDSLDVNTGELDF